MGAFGKKSAILRPVDDLFSRTPEAISVYEVSLRDGLQNESVTVPLPGKLRLIDALVQAGLRRIEATSFVSPRWIPQLSDAEELIRFLPKNVACMFSALCPNERGLTRALASGVPEIAVFMSSSESHNRKNTNRTIADTLDVYRVLIAEAVRSGLRVRAYLSTVWGCPYEGEIAADKSVVLAKALVESGAYEVSLGDTIGAGTPRQTQAILAAMLDAIPLHQVAMHMHDTRGTALANIVVGLEMGIRTFDASIGGLGGCPYAPGAAGNVATEDLVYLLEGMGLKTGIDLGRLIEAGRVAESIVARKLPSKVLQAGARSLRA
jgi:hydroxymethylglutaryl-CoA lyase